MTPIDANVEVLPPEDENPHARVLRLRKELELETRKRDLRAAYGINFYRPHFKQHKFHTCDKTSRFLRTGNRFGKSECGIIEDISWCLGGRLWYRNAFDILDGTRAVAEAHPGGKDHPYVTRGIPRRPVKGLLLVVDWDMAKEVFTNQTDDPKTCGKLWKFLPKDSIGKVTLSRGGHIERVEIKRLPEFGGGVSTLKIDTIESWKHNKLGGESADWDFIHVDEPIPELMFKSYARGLMDRNGSSWFTCTPLDQMWINDMFIPDSRRINAAATDAGFSAKDSFVITGSSYDNPHRNDAGLEKFKATLTREEVECRIDGNPLELAGAVYREFIWDMHVLADLPKGWTAFHEPPLDYTVRVAWDVHGARVPQAVLFAATAPTGDVFIYDELFCEPLITPNAQLVKRKLANRHVVSQIIDPRALIVNPVTETADVLEALMAEGLFFEPASKDMQTGISRTKEKLNERNAASSLPTTWFSPKLTRTLWEFSHYVYDTKTNEPKDQDDHMMENLRRLVLNGLGYVEPPTAADYSRRRSFHIPSHFDASLLTHA